MPRYRNTVLFFTLAALWGVAFMAIKAGLEYFPPVLFAAIRYDLAAVILLLYAAVAADNWIPRSREDWIVATLDGLLLVGAYNVFVFLGGQTVTSAVAAILVSLNPILSTVFSRAVLPDERLTLVGIVGLLIGFGGVGLVASPDLTNLLAGNTVGQVLLVAAAASFALGSVAVQLVDDDLSTEGTTAWACLVGAVMLHVTSISLGESTVAIVWTTEAILALGYVSVGSSVVGYFVYFDLLDRLGPVEINLVSYAAPVFTAVSGWFFLSETVTTTTVVGFLFIFLGFILIKREAVRTELSDTLRLMDG